MINRNPIHTMLLCAIASVAVILFGTMPLASVSAQTGTTVIHFDPPDFFEGQIITSISGVTFPSSPTIFSPNRVTTFSPPYALHSTQRCNDQQCSNHASQLPIQFNQDVREVSMRVGNDDDWDYNICFPETLCPTYARLVGFDTNGLAVADSRDVFITDNRQGTGSNFGTVPITIEISISSPAANIRSAILYVGENTLDHEGHNTPIRAQIDELTFTVPSGPKPITPAPPAITIKSPHSGDSFSYPYQINLAGNVTALGGLVAFCTSVNRPAIALNDCRQRNWIQSDGSFNVPVSDAHMLGPTHNVLYAFASDSFGQMSQASVPITIQKPPAPTIRIFTPEPGEKYSTTSPQVYFWGEITIPGGLAAFCTRVNEANIPPLDQCTQIGDVSEYGSFGIPIKGSSLQLGNNTLYAFAYDRWGQTGVGSVQFYMPTDLRITAMEITQGIQIEQIPLNTNSVAKYTGVTLVSGGKTVVRVFVNAIAGEPDFSGIATLCSVIDEVFYGGEIGRAEHCISPDNRQINFVAGVGEPTLAERADPDGAFVFTLPPSWTRDLDGVIALTAKIYDPYECSGCENNNTFTVTDVKFVDRSPIRISPVEVIWTNSHGTVIQPDRPDDVFSRTADISPLPEGGLFIDPYAGQIDVTDLIKNDSCDDACGKGIWNRVEAFEIRDLPGYTIGISRGLNYRAFEQLVPYARFPPGLVLEPIAIADQDRPLTEVTHEFYHALGYYHAGFSCPYSPPVIHWPPDDRGLIQGIGLDRHPGSGPLPGTYRIIAPGSGGDAGGKQPSEWVDFMSYCFDWNWITANRDYNVWISVRNWNAFGSPSPNGLLPDDITVGQIGQPGSAFAAAVPTSQPTLRLLATTDGADIVHILSVQQGIDGMVTAYKESPYQLIMRDKQGNEISRSYIVPLVGHIDGDDKYSFGLSAEVPAEGVASLDITYNNVVVARRIRSANTPVVTIFSPQAGDRIPGTGDIVVRWKSSDADGDPLMARVEYSVDNGQTYRVLTAGVRGNQTSLPARLFSSSQQARIRITVNDGFNDGVAVSAPFVAEGFAPQVHIIEPIDNLKIYADVGLRLVGQAVDDSGQILTGEQLHWFAGENPIGTGSVLDGPKLSPGVIKVRLEATDTKGRTASATVNVEVLSVEGVPGTPKPPYYLIALAVIAVLIVLAVIVFAVARRQTSV